MSTPKGLVIDVGAPPLSSVKIVRDDGTFDVLPVSVRAIRPPRHRGDQVLVELVATVPPENIVHGDS